MLKNKKLYLVFFTLSFTLSPLSSKDLFKALEKQNIQEFKKLLQKKENLDIKDHKGTPLVQIAFENKNLDLVYELLKKGASPNLRDAKKQALIHRVDIRQKNKPLMDQKLLKFMLEKRANPNLKNNFGRNAARLYFDDPEKVRILMSYGADFEMKAFNGETGLLMMELKLKRLKNESNDIKYDGKNYSFITNLIYWIKKPSYKKDLKKKIKELEKLIQEVKVHQKKLD